MLGNFEFADSHKYKIKSDDIILFVDCTLSDEIEIYPLKLKAGTKIDRIRINSTAGIMEFYHRGEEDSFAEFVVDVQSSKIRYDNQPVNS